jgi:VanZ family protein
VKRKYKEQIFFLIVAALWGYLIFYLSSVPDLASGLPSMYDFIFRKMAHVCVFMVLTYLIASSLDKDSRAYLLFVIVIVVFYAFVDEFHQTGVVNRHGSPIDIMVDSMGVYLGIRIYQYKPPSKLFKKFFK